MGYNVRGSLENCNNLKKLHYEPDKHCYNFLDLKLPSSLKSLNLYQCQCFKHSLQTLHRYRYRFSLEEICLQFDSEDEEFSRVMVSLLQDLTCVNTIKVAFKSSKIESTDLMLNQYLHDVSHLVTPVEAVIYGTFRFSFDANPIMRT